MTIPAYWILQCAGIFGALRREGKPLVLPGRAGKQYNLCGKLPTKSDNKAVSLATLLDIVRALDVPVYKFLIFED